MSHDFSACLPLDADLVAVRRNIVVGVMPFPKCVQCMYTAGTAPSPIISWACAVEGSVMLGTT